jgi:hypothetical protein
MSNIPNGWTDDMNISLPPGHTVEELVKFVIEQGQLEIIDDENNEDKLVSTFGISPQDAELVRERVSGGMVRAALGNPYNKPDPIKDPFAYTSYMYVKNKLSQSKKIPWWKFWR